MAKTSIFGELGTNFSIQNDKFTRALAEEFAKKKATEINTSLNLLSNALETQLNNGALLTVKQTQDKEMIRLGGELQNKQVGWIIQEGDKIKNISSGPKTKILSLKSSGLIGEFIENLFFNYASNEDPMPDIAGILEAKAAVLSRGNVSVGGATFLLAHSTKENPITLQEAQKALTEIQIITIAVIKTIEKMANLLLIRPRVLEKEGNNKWLMFLFEQIKIYFNLNTEKLIENAYGSGKKFFSTKVSMSTSPVKEGGIIKYSQSLFKAEINVSLNIPRLDIEGIKYFNKELTIDDGLYRKTYDILNDPGANSLRLAFVKTIIDNQTFYKEFARNKQLVKVYQSAKGEWSRK